MNIYFSMAASITPGPVNILALSAGAQFGFNATLRHVLGATLGFTLLLILLGLGLHQLLTLWPVLTQFIQWAGSAFLLFMAYQLAFDDGKLGSGNRRQAPSFWYGALLQWLNPKAWLASVASLGGVCRRRRQVAAVAVCGDLLRYLLCLGGLLGLRRHYADRFIAAGPQRAAF